MKIGFDNEKYTQLQSEKILERIEQFGEKLYLEFGGKLFDDYHASRVLPGFSPDAKIQMLAKLASKTEVIIAISAQNIENNKIREDSGISYDGEIFRMIEVFSNFGLKVSSVVITRFRPSTKMDEFISRLKNHNIAHYFHYEIENYPYNVEKIVSEEGYGKNDYIPTTKPLVVVTAPGPGSGKMATCLSQLFHEHKRGIRAGYVKFETFPVWNLPLSHPVNLAYESATLDLGDVNMIDPFHLETYQETAINYNRDIETFPLLEAIFEKIFGKCPYKSPTDMGVNMVGFCFSDEEIIKKSAQKEIIRRHFSVLTDQIFGKNATNALEKSEIIMKKSHISPDSRKIIAMVKSVSEEKNTIITGIEMDSGEIITGKQTSLMTSSSACIINALKFLAKIDDNIHIIAPNVLQIMQKLKKMKDKSTSQELSVDEILIAIAISAATSPVANMALEKIPELKGLDAHASHISPKHDIQSLKNLEIPLSMDPNFS